MSLTTEWKEIRKALGTFTGKLDNIMQREEDLDKALENALTRGYNKAKKEMCHDCKHKQLSGTMKNGIWEEEVVYVQMGLMMGENINYKCSECGFRVRPKTNFCSKCGARMTNVDEVSNDA